MGARLLDPAALPATHFSFVLYEGRAPRRPNDTTKMKLGEHVRVQAEHIQRYCFNDGSTLREDLAAVLSAVRMADRAFSRLHGTAWARTLHVEVPVFEPVLWRSAKVSLALSDALQYLTGDIWDIKFAQRKGRHTQVAQPHLVALPQQGRVFMPYSGGLDSFASAGQIQQEFPAAELILVNVQASSSLSGWRNLSRLKAKDLQTVQVATHFDEPHRSEPTFRSRPFMYDLLACYGAAIAAPAMVVIPENGQGSLGGSLVPLGDEAPHRSCHPGFTTRLSRLVEALTGQFVKIEHPALFQTKGQVLAGLAGRNGSTDGWLASHRSCSYDARHSSKDKRSLHCGVCGNCILRRVALQSARLSDSTEYEARHLTSSTFAGMFTGAVPRTWRAKQDIAFNSIRSMQRLADLAEQPHSIRVAAEVAGLSRALGEPIQETKTKMERFLHQHKTEWSQFLSECGPHSWVAEHARN